MIYVIHYTTGPLPALVRSTEWICARWYNHRLALSTFRRRYPDAQVLAVRLERGAVA